MAAKPVPLTELLSDAQRILARRFDQELAQAGFPDLSLALGSNVLRFLGEGPRTVQELAQLAGVSKQIVSQQARRLSLDGYVEMGPVVVDARKKAVWLTQRGHDASRAAADAFSAVEQALASEVGPATLNTLRAGLSMIRQSAAARVDTGL